MAKRKSNRAQETREVTHSATRQNSRLDRSNMVTREALPNLNVFSITSRPIRQARLRTVSEPVEQLSQHNSTHQKHLALRIQAQVEAKTENKIQRSQLTLEHDNSPQKVRDNVCKKRPENNKTKSGSGGKPRKYIPWC